MLRAPARRRPASACGSRWARCTRRVTRSVCRIAVPALGVEVRLVDDARHAVGERRDDAVRRAGDPARVGRAPEHVVRVQVERERAGGVVGDDRLVHVHRALRLAGGAAGEVQQRRVVRDRSARIVEVVGAPRPSGASQVERAGLVGAGRRRRGARARGRAARRGRRDLPPVERRRWSRAPGPRRARAARGSARARTRRTAGENTLPVLQRAEHGDVELRDAPGRARRRGRPGRRRGSSRTLAKRFVSPREVGVGAVAPCPVAVEPAQRDAGRVVARRAWRSTASCAMLSPRHRAGRRAPSAPPPELRRIDGAVALQIRPDARLAPGGNACVAHGATLAATGCDDVGGCTQRTCGKPATLTIRRSSGGARQSCSHLYAPAPMARRARSPPSAAMQGSRSRTPSGKVFHRPSCGVWPGRECAGAGTSTGQTTQAALRVPLGRAPRRPAARGAQTTEVFPPTSRLAAPSRDGGAAVSGRSSCIPQQKGHLAHAPPGCADAIRTPEQILLDYRHPRRETGPQSHGTPPECAGLPKIVPPRSISPRGPWRPGTSAEAARHIGRTHVQPDPSQTRRALSPSSPWLARSPRSPPPPRPRR